MQPSSLRPTVAFLGALLFTTATAHAEGPRPERKIALRTAIELALKGNPTFGAALADVAAAEGAVKAARGADDFVVDASARYDANRQELVPGSPLQQPKADDMAGTLALTKPLPSGGRVGLESTHEYSRTEFATPNAAPGQFDRQTSEVYAPSVRLTFSHPLLRGFGASVARADRRRAAARRDIAGLARDATAAALVRDVVRTYADVTAASDELEIRRASADAARDQLRRAQADIEVGKQPPSASAEIEVAIARREEAVLLAEQAMVERSLELERLTGQPFERETTTLVASDALALPREAPSLDDAVAAALDRNPLARAAEARARATSIETDVASSGLLPQLDVVLAGGPTGSSTDLRTAYSTMAEFRGYAVSAGLVFQAPLGRHAAKGAHEIAHAGTERAAMEETDVRRQIAAAVVRGVVAVHTAGRRAAVLSRSTQSAELDLAAERARFDSGRSTNFDVLRRQDQLALAKLGALAARLDYAKSLADVESLTGAILDRYGVKVP